MPIDVNWDDDAQTVIRYEFWSPWTWNEYRQAIDRAWELAGSVSHPTDTITDMSASRLLPEGLFRNVKQSVVEIPESTQTVVLVGGGLFVETMLNVIKSVYRNAASKFFVVETVEEARVLIQQRREAPNGNPS